MRAFAYVLVDNETVGRFEHSVFDDKEASDVVQQLLVPPRGQEASRAARGLRAVVFLGLCEHEPGLRLSVLFVVERELVFDAHALVDVTALVQRRKRHCKLLEHVDCKDETSVSTK